MVNNADKSKAATDGTKLDQNWKPADLDGEALIHLSSLIKTYQFASNGSKALNNVNLEIYPGEFVAITGKSGAGKTTLINMMAGIDQATSGEVWVDGMPLHEMPEKEITLWRGQNMGVIYQSFHLMPNLSILDNVILPIDLCGLYRPKESARRALDLLTQVELQDHAYKLPSGISGGQQQRVAIARALANNPSIIVADEPTGRLDSSTAESIFQIFLELVKAGKTIVMVTHDRALAQRASRTLEIVDGEIPSGTAFKGSRLN